MKFSFILLGREEMFSLFIALRRGFCARDIQYEFAHETVQGCN